MAENPASLLVLTRWDQYFETYESQRLKGACKFVAMPTKHDGRSFRRLLRERDGVALYGAWALLVQVAMKMPMRGVLADASGPLNAIDLEDKTMAPAKTFERLINLVTSEHIGWADLITDPAVISEYSRKIAEICAPRPKAERDSPQAPARSRKNSALPAESHAPPADSGSTRRFPQIPADSSTPAGNLADSRHSRARAGEPDLTRQDTTIPPTVPQGGPESASLSALEDTVSFLCGLFGRKRNRLGQAAEHELARWSDSLPLSSEQKKSLAWFYGLPADPDNIDLRGRHNDADKLAVNLFPALERAAAYAKKTGPPEQKKSAVPTPAPAGGLEWLAANYPQVPPPVSWSAVPESIRSQYELERRCA